MSNARYRIFIVIMALSAFALLACISSGLSAPPATPPSGRIDISMEAANRLEARLKESLEQSSQGEIILRFTSEEITSYVALKLQQKDQAIFSNPQIWFTSGKIFMTGVVKGVVPFNPPAFIVATAVARNQRVEFTIEKAQMGPLPFPQDLLNSISQSVNETLDESIDPNIQVSRLEILEGEMIIVLIRPQVQPG